MPSKLGTPLGRRSVAWFWFAVAAALTALLVRNALAGDASWGPAFVLLGVTIAIYIEPRLRKRMKETIQVDGSGVLRVDGNIREQVFWSDVSEIRIITTNAGPSTEDVFFALVNVTGGGCLVPHEAAVRTNLLAELQARFPGLDDQLVVKAMGSTSNNTFIVWKKQDTLTMHKDVR